MRRFQIAAASAALCALSCAAAPQAFLLPVENSDGRAVRYFASHAIDAVDTNAEHAVVIVHGLDGGTRDGAWRVRQIAAARGRDISRVYFVAPCMLVEKLLKPEELSKIVYWRGGGWQGGGDSPVAKGFSSYDVLDRMFERLNDAKLYPRLRSVLFCGYSAGAQVMSRYMATSPIRPRRGLQVNFAAGAPSTWLFFDGKARWHYGLARQANRYASRLSDGEIMRNLAGRYCLAFCGTDDVGEKSLDMKKGAMAQGPNRYRRFLNFRRHVASFPELRNSFTFLELVGRKHGGQCYDSDAFVKLMFGERSRANVADLAPAVEHPPSPKPPPANLALESPVPGYDYGRIYYYVPKEIDLKKPAPLLVFMHGGNSASPETAPERYLTDGTGYMMPEFTESPFIVVAPSAPPGPNGSRWNQKGVFRYIDAVIAAAKRRYKIDSERIFLGGHSMGGFGAYHLGQVMADRFAGVWMSSGAWCRADFRALLGTPVYLQHGRLDCSPLKPHAMAKGARPHNWTGPSYARSAHELMSRCGVEHVYDEYSGGHSLADPAAKEATRRFFAWARRQRRAPYAKRAALVTPCGSMHFELEELERARWLELLEAEKGDIMVDAVALKGPRVAAAEADLDRQTYDLVKRPFRNGARIVAENLGGNRFKAKTENVRRFAILLAPQMGDLSKPFTVEVDGKNHSLGAEPVSGVPDYTARLVVEVR